MQGQVKTNPNCIAQVCRLIAYAVYLSLHFQVLISTLLDNPRGLAVDPGAGYIYWSDWGDQPRIERSFMDGTEREILVDSDIGWPNEIALDLQQRTVYWCDARRKQIEVCPHCVHISYRIVSYHIM